METEYKFRLASRADLEALLRPHPATSPAYQINRFYDTADRALRSAGLNLRLRTEVVTLPQSFRTEHIIALKGPNVVPEGNTSLTSRAEEEKEFPTASWFDFRRYGDAHFLLNRLDYSPMVQQAKAAAAGAQIQLLGDFSNQRWKVPYQAQSLPGVSLMLEIDETTFKPGVVHYEVEVETDSPSVDLERELQVYFRAVGANLLDVPPSGKAKRFFELM